MADVSSSPLNRDTLLYLLRYSSSPRLRLTLRLVCRAWSRWLPHGLPVFDAAPKEAFIRAVARSRTPTLRFSGSTTANVSRLLADQLRHPGSLCESLRHLQVVAHSLRCPQPRKTPHSCMSPLSAFTALQSVKLREVSWRSERSSLALSHTAPFSSPSPPPLTLGRRDCLVPF